MNETIEWDTDTFKESIELTKSQVEASDQLTFFWKMKHGLDRTVGGMQTRAVPLLVGPSGVGKTAVVRHFTDQLNIPMFALNAATWIPWGARCDHYTLKLLAAFLKEYPAGVIFIDELNKLRVGSSDNAWMLSCLTEIISLLDADKRLLQLGFDEATLKTLENFMMIGAAAFQEEWSEMLNTGDMGFNGRAKGEGVDSQTFLKAVRDQQRIPEELLFRFNDRLIMIEPPSLEETKSRIQQIRDDLEQEPLSALRLDHLASEAVASGRTMRWLEAYVGDMVAQCPNVIDFEPPVTAKRVETTFLELYGCSFQIVKRLSYKLSKHCREFDIRLASVEAPAGRYSKLAGILVEFSETAYQLTSPVISDLCRAQLFQTLRTQAAPLMESLHDLRLPLFNQDFPPATIECLIKLVETLREFQYEAQTLHTINSDKASLMRDMIPDRKDIRVEWF